METNYDIIIVGAGVIGANIARELSSYKCRVLVIDKAGDVCERTSMSNSAIVHSGYDPLPGSNKAKFNIEGNKMFGDLCKRLDVPFSRIGSLTVAVEESQMEQLYALEKRAKENGVEVRIINKEELLKIEPNINPNSYGALLAPSAGIVDPFLFVSKNMENAIDNGVKLNLNEEVEQVKDLGNHFEVITDRNTYYCKVFINAAGHGALDITNQLEKQNYEIQPRKGEYFVLDHFNENFIKHTLFPLPTNKGKGILISPTYSGNFLVGPSSELSEADDHCTDVETLTKIREAAQSIVPVIPFGELIRVFAGVRATPSDHDFHIDVLKTHPHFVNLCGIESPGFASSPSIAKYVVEKLVNPILDLKKNPNYIDKVRPMLITRKMNKAAREKLIKENPDYGVIICQCEKISKGEILDVMSRSDHPKTIKAIKKRCRAGFGKCQGGFCQPLVALLISNHYHIPLLNVKYSKDGSNIVRYKSKENIND